MSRSKEIRYNAAHDESLLIQSGKEFFENCKGKWKSDYFGNNNPIVLELACGRGEYTVGLSQIFPDKNFIGVDVKGERMMLGIKIYKSKVTSSILPTRQITNSPNIAFLRTIIHHIDQFFVLGEVDEIWIVHPDPRPKGHDARRRITSPRFLRMYESILKPAGLLRLKTDDDGLFEYSLEEIGKIRYKEEKIGIKRKEEPEVGNRFELVDMTRDLHHSPLLSDHHGIRTHYEQEALDAGKTIKYAVWKKK